jgi:osmoprotectant transport system permease protein
MKWVYAAVTLVASLGLATAADAATLRVGSKRFTESMILAEIAAQAARATGETRVEHVEGLGGTAIVLAALEQGAIDVYPEYSGSLKESLLHDVRASDADLARALLARGLGVTAALGFENAYALAMKRERARMLNVTRLSELAAHPELRITLSNEFIGRSDGWSGLRAAYGLGALAPRGMDHGLAYLAVDSGAADVTDAYTTDAALARLDLVTLSDDRHFFPSYLAIFVYRLAAQTSFPRAFAAIEAMAGRIDAATMTRLNAEAEVQRLAPADIAAGFLGAAPSELAARPSLLRGIGQVIVVHGPRHLLLVLLATFFAVLAGVPLGVLAARSPVGGGTLLTAAGLVQTIPSLALLCFAVPLLGVGALPAMVALFVYGLLPIAGNTLVGLRGIPLALRESAAALGLAPLDLLMRVELPMAAPVILTGIKTSTITAVGTATIAAFIGAGGFGEPISTGLNLNDTRMILEGAVPAALLALLVQGAFAVIERRLVPAGLR